MVAFDMECCRDPGLFEMVRLQFFCMAFKRYRLYCGVIYVFSSVSSLFCPRFVSGWDDVHDG